MTFTKQAPFTKKVTDLPNTPSPDYTPAQIKEYFETPVNELKTTLNKVVDDLNADRWVGTTKIALQGVERGNIKLGAVGVDQLDPSITNQPKTEFEVQAKFEAVDSQLAQTETDLEDRGINLKLSGLVGDGVKNNNTAISNALNSSAEKFYLPAGEYLLTDTITVNASTKRKVVVGTTGAIFKVNLASSKTLFDLLCNVEFHNITLDFSNNHCKSVFSYRSNFGLIKLSNVEIRNIKDTDSSTSSRLIDIPAEGNKLELENIRFKDVYKLGNGTITDASGTVNGIIYGGTITTESAPGGQIKTVRVENFHNIDSLGNIIIEDTTGIYLSLSGKNSNVKIYDIEGIEFGKRLLKIQASDVDIDKVKGVSETGDSLSVIGALSEDGVFVSDDIRISNIVARGNMEYAIATSCSNTVISDVQIDVYGSNSLNSGVNHFGIYLGDNAHNTKIRKSKIKAKRPIGLYNSLNELKDIYLNDVELILTNSSSTAINQLYNSSYGFNGFYISNVKLKTSSSPSTNQDLLNISSSFAGRNKNLNIDGVDIDASDPISPTYVKTLAVYIRFTDGVSIKKVTFNHSLSDAYVADLVVVLDSTNVEIEDVKTLVKCNRTLLLQRINLLKIKQQSLNGEGVTGHIVLSDSTKVEIDSVNEKYKILYGTQDATEVMRNKGTTAQRPKRAYQSYRYFDTTINKDIITKTGASISSDGTVTTPPVWVDAMGTTV